MLCRLFLAAFVLVDPILKCLVVAKELEDRVGWALEKLRPDLPDKC